MGDYGAWMAQQRDGWEARAIAAERERDEARAGREAGGADHTALEEARRILDLAWGVIANAGEGNWGRESDEWQAAAIRWREQYHAWLSTYRSTEGQ